MQTLKAPPGHLSVVVGGTQFNVKDGLISDIDDQAANMIRAHDPLYLPHDPEKDLSIAADGAAREAIMNLDKRVASLGSRVEAVEDDVSKAADAAKGRIDELEKEVADMGRNVLFADLKAMGVVVARTMKTDDLRKVWVTETTKAEAADAKPEGDAGAGAAKDAGESSSDGTKA